MSLRYRTRYLETGDMIDSRDWNLNHAEYIQEWNGYLDRDNIVENAVVESIIVRNAFNEIAADGFTQAGSPFDVDITTMGWQADDVASRRIGRLTVIPEVDVLLICEYSGWHTWSTTTVAYDSHVTAGDTGVDDGIRYRITVDGVTITESGWIADHHSSGSVYIVGAIPVVPGSRVVQVECQIGGVWRMVYNDDNHSSEIIIQALRDITLAERELVVHMRRR